MAHAVFIQNPTSIYDDAHGRHYHFPRRYLRMVEEAVGDWIVFYQGRHGANGYTHVQRVLGVRADPARADHFYADLDPAEMLDLEWEVPRLRADGTPFETRLPPTGGLNASAVRRLTEAEFAAIVNEGFRERIDPDAHPRSGPLYAVPGSGAHAQAGLAPPDRRAILSSRPARDAAFARRVRRAYRGRCAVSGLTLRNGGGRAEVQAAHIRAVADGGPDVVQNGIALSGTVHWMFDRGLIRVADDYSLLISHNKVDLETVNRLVNPERRLMVPADPRLRPHPDYLRHHREKFHA
jgi:putative restriction endonuclease